MRIQGVAHLVPQAFLGALRFHVSIIPRHARGLRLLGLAGARGLEEGLAGHGHGCLWRAAPQHPGSGAMSGAVQPGGCWEARVASTGLRLGYWCLPAPAPPRQKRLAEQALFQGAGLAWTSGASRRLRAAEASLRGLYASFTRLLRFSLAFYRTHPVDVARVPW